jgi:hypothetical protein
LRTASHELTDQSGSSETELALEDLAEILEPAEVSTLEIAPPSKADKWVLLGGLLLAFTVGAGFVVVIVQSKAAPRPPAMVTKTISPVRSTVQPATRAFTELPVVPSTPIADRSAGTAAPRRRITAMNSSAMNPSAMNSFATNSSAMNSSAIDSPATPPATPVEPADDWVDPFNDEATPAEPPSDDWKDPFAESRGTR